MHEYNERPKDLDLELWLSKSSGRLLIVNPNIEIGVGNAYAYPDPRSNDDVAYPAYTTWQKKGDFRHIGFSSYKPSGYIFLQFKPLATFVPNDDGTVTFKTWGKGTKCERHYRRYLT